MAPDLLIGSASMKSNVVLLNVVREVQKAEKSDPAYHARILGMNKLELLEEMMLFQEAQSSSGQLTVEMMVRGQLLFKALEESAETEELRQLARSFRRHLRLELEAYMKNQPQVFEQIK
jgi:hypothetical protein